MIGSGKILDVMRLGPNLWIYSMWHDDAGYYEMGIPRKTHIQIIEIEGDIIGRKIEFSVEGKELSMRFLEEERNDADKTG